MTLNNGKNVLKAIGLSDTCSHMHRPIFEGYFRKIPRRAFPTLGAKESLPDLTKHVYKGSYTGRRLQLLAQSSGSSSQGRWQNLFPEFFIQLPVQAIAPVPPLLTLPFLPYLPFLIPHPSSICSLILAS
jgi:hypothetical protein